MARGLNTTLKRHGGARLEKVGVRDGEKIGWAGRVVFVQVMETAPCRRAVAGRGASSPKESYPSRRLPSQQLTQRRHRSLEERRQTHRRRRGGQNRHDLLRRAGVRP